MRLRPITLRLLAVAAAVLAMAVGGAPAAGAHGGDGILEVEAAHPTDTGIHYIVRLVWQSDGDPITDATVTATPVSPDGDELTPVDLPPYDDDGRYAALVEMPEPGSWTVRFASDDPATTAETSTEITETGATDAGGGDAGFAAAEDGTGDSEAADAGADDGGSDGLPILLVVAAAVVAVGGVVTAFRIIRRTRPGPGGSATNENEPTTGAAES